MWVWNLLVALLLLSAIGFVVTYVSVFHLAFVERVVALLLRKGLRGLAQDDAAGRQASYTVERKPRGTHILNLHLAKHVLEKLSVLDIEVETASVESLEVSFPTWTTPLRLQIRGLQFTVRQRNMPQHVCASKLAEEERRSSDELKFAKLDAIDRLLWGTQSRSQADSSDGSMGVWLRAHALHRLIALAVRFLEIDAASLRCTYLQEGEPGPLPNPCSHMAGKDGAEISIRRMLLTPQLERANAAVSVAAAEGSCPEPQVIAPEPQGLLHVLRMPAAIWRHVTLDRQISSQAVVAGVDISLIAFGLRPGSQPQPAPIAVPQFTPGAAAARPKRRRGSEPAAAASNTPATSVLPTTRPSTATVETHAILRQWGAEATFVIAPPGSENRGHATPAAPAPAAPPHENGHHPARPTVVPSPFAEAGGIPNGVHANHGTPPEPKPAENGPPPGVNVDGWSTGNTEPTGEEGGPDEASGFVCGLNVDIRLRALVLRLTPESLAVAFRMVDRANEYVQYSSYWQTRPEVPVRSSPSSWWQHAGAAAKRECRLVSRREVPGSAISARRANRLQYQQLYARTHSRLRSFTEPERRWWQRRQTPKAGAEDTALLKVMEQQLTMEEIAHFRAGVAALHSTAMLANTDHFGVAIDAVDAVVGNLGPVPAPIAAMLFGDHDAVRPRQLLALSLKVGCPKLGAQLVIAPEDESSAPPENAVRCIEPLISHISCSMGPLGDTRVVVGSIALAGKAAEDGPVTGHILKSPSLAANRMLQVADLHGVASKARRFTAELNMHNDKFLRLRTVADAGKWMRQAVSGAEGGADSAPPTEDSEAAVLRPPGMHVVADLAAIEVEYARQVVLAGLRFVEQLARLKGRVLLGTPTAGGPRVPDLVVDPGQPVTLKERVLHAFAQQNMPVYKPLTMPPSLIKLSCPGLAARLNYDHHTAVGCQEALSAESARHELIAAITRVKGELCGDNFMQFMRGGTIQRMMLHAYLDLFCYQPPASRPRAGGEATSRTRATAFGNRTITGQRRQSGEDGADDSAADRDSADSQDMAAMAKVWAHPEDLHMFPVTQMSSLKSTLRGSSFSGQQSLRAGGGKNRVPPFPMIPLLKVAGWQMEAAQKLHLLPAAPGSLSISVAGAMHGIMAWVSPWQVSHLLSIIDSVKRHFPAPIDTGSGREQYTPVQKAGLSAMRTQLRIQASVELPLISAICSVARSSAELEAAMLRPQRPNVRGQWRHRVPESDPAYLWTHCLAPTYGVNVLGSRAAISFQGTGHLRGGLTVEGLLVRDLQLPPRSRFAYFMRPLPARAEELTRHATRFRTRMLRVVNVSVACRRWQWAVRRVTLRRRCTLAAWDLEARMHVRTAGLPFASFVGMRSTGPQLVACCYLPPAVKYLGHPDFRPAPPAKLQIQMGQLLLYARVSSNNRMLPFCSQILDLVGGVSSTPPPGSGESKREAPPVQRPAQRHEMQGQQTGARFAGLQMEIGIVGVHLKVVVQGQELLSLQLQEAALTLDVAPDPPPPDGNSLAVALRILDISIRDLQALPEHATVLQPNKKAEHCSLAVDFTSPLAAAKPPLLVIEFANPRFLALFRFVHDVLHGVDILTSAFAKNSGKPAAESSQTSKSGGSEATGPEILLHLTNAGVVLPASSKSLRVLAADVDYVMLGMPGTSVSDSALNSAGLPSLHGMLHISMKASRLFKEEVPDRPAPGTAATVAAQSPANTAPAEAVSPKAAETQPAHRPTAAARHWVQSNAVKHQRRRRIEPGVLYLNQGTDPGLSQAERKGVLNISLDDEKVRGQEREVASTPAVERESLQGVSPTRPPVATADADLQRGLEAPLPGKAPSESGDFEDEPPKATLAVFVEGIVISRACLKSLAGKSGPGGFCPASVHHFHWPKQNSSTVDRAPFIQPSSYCMIMYERKCLRATGGSYQQAHLAAAPVVVIMNAPNYAALLGFAQGNLTEISSYDRSGRQDKEKEPQRTTFNPAFQFAPPRDDAPTFRLTASLPLLTTVFEADPQFWQSGTIRSRLGDPANIRQLPFLRLQVHGVELDLGVLDRSKATYLQLSAAAASCDDLRLAYSKIMTEYEVYSEDTFQDVPRYKSRPPAGSSMLRSASGSRSEESLEEVAAEVASELQHSEQQASLSRRQSLGRRERSGEFLRLKSIQMVRRERTSASDAAAVDLPASPWGSSPPPALPPVPPPPPTAVPVPVISMELVDSLEAYFPAGSPVVHLLRAPAPLPPSEATHLSHQGSPRPGTEALGATIALLKDGTVAVELRLTAALLQWPFLSDLSLTSAAASIFSPPPSEDKCGDAALAAETAVLAEVMAPWLYFNAILEDCQLFVPVCDPDTLEEGVQHYFGGGAAAMNLHERLADLMLMELAFSMEDADAALRVEERGIALTWSALRVSYAAGGDGGGDVKADLRRFSAFVRDPGAVVTCMLLPHSCSFHLEMRAPRAEENLLASRRTLAAIRIQRAWRRFCKLKASGYNSRAMLNWANSRQASRNAGLSSRVVSAEIRPSVPRLTLQQRVAELMEQLVEEVASPRTHAILKEYYSETKGGGNSYQQKKPAQTFLRVKMAPLTVRAAFSHVPFLQSVIWMINTMVLGTAASTLEPRRQSATELEAAADEFRPSSIHMDGTIQGLALVLCNDKPQTFGAPDVLRLSLDQLTLKYVMDRKFHDRPPDQVAQLEFQIGAQFLNNSSSRWEAICENWQVNAELVDNVSPIYRSDFQRHIWLTSKQHLSVHFNPASMLSAGDLLAFLSEVQAPLLAYKAAGSERRLATLEAAPEMAEQMAQQGGITARVPQKYLIQNQSGLRVYYWVQKDGDARPARTFSLASGVSETLKVEPRRKILQHVTPGRPSIGKVQNVICLHFEGNWLPIKDVAVSVVGKYRYQMYSPAEHDRAPVVVDVILVGRTKIITLHSGLWLENRTDRSLAFRLHIPITPLVAPSAASSKRQQRGQDDHRIGPLLPGSGTYLPVTAVLGGSLFLRPSGFSEAERDVIRLSPNIPEVEAQQGRISCQPLPHAASREPLHCSLIVLPAQVNSEFQAFKHIEMVGPGELMKASEPLEATLAVQPTLVLTNALPYSIEVTVWMVAPFRKLRREKAAAGKTGVMQSLYFDYQQMRTAFTGTVPVTGEANPYQTNGVAGQSQKRQQLDLRPAPASPSLLSLAETEASDSDSGSEAAVFGEWQGEKQKAASGNETPGRRISVTLKPGASQNVYANLEGNVLVHVAVPQLGMVARQWAVVCWSQEQVSRENVFDAKYIYRLPKEISLRHLESRSRRWTRASTKTSVMAWRSVASGLREAASKNTAPAAKSGKSVTGLGKRLAANGESPEKPLWFNAVYSEGSPQGSAPSPGEQGIAEAPDKTAGPSRNLPAELNPRNLPADITPGPSVFSQEIEADEGSQSDEEDEDDTEDAAELLRDVFQAWRERAVRSSIARLKKAHHPAKPGVNAPEELLLHIQNSLAEQGRDSPICRLSFYSPCWVDNRTDMDLVFQDHASAAPNPLLLGYKTPLDYREVLSPAVGLVEPATPGGSHRSFWDIQDSQEIKVSPTLLNKQERTRFCLAGSKKRRYSSVVHIDTVGLKGSMRVKGPPSTGMRTLFKSAAAAVTPRKSEAEASDSRSLPPEAGEACALDQEEPEMVEEVKVRIEPLLTVDIRELARVDSETNNSTAVMIRPRSEASRKKLVSLELTPVRRPAAMQKTDSQVCVEETSKLDMLVLENAEEPEEATLRTIFAPKPQQPDAVRFTSEKSAATVGRREFEFIAEVTSAPPSSVFRLTKVLTIKPRLVVDNQTGMAIEVKQRGTPDLDVDPFYGGETRCSLRLEVNQRKAFHWDNCDLEKMLVVRPLGEAACGGTCEWQWSGGFHAATREEYFGLRIRHKSIPTRAINIPVNCTVAPSGFVLVTFKSRHSVPPYRIENRTADVVVYFAQSSLRGTREKWNWLAPSAGGSAMAYAWDEPTLEHRLQVQAHVRNRMGRPYAASYDFDKLGAKPPLNLPSAAKTFSSGITLERMRAAQKDDTHVPDAVKERVASVLASEFSKKVYVTVFADGPTRVLRLSDEPNATAGEGQQSVLDLAARLKQVEAELNAVDSKFLQLHGPSGAGELDLYGRSALPQTSADPAAMPSKISVKDGRGGAHTARIRLRQRGIPGTEGSPLALSRQDYSLDPGEVSDTASVTSSFHGRNEKRTSMNRAAEPPSKPPLHAMMSVLDPEDLSQHLAKLHVPTSSQAVQGSELMRSMAAADSALLLGGDLLVTIWQADGLKGVERMTHPFARARIGEQSQLTSVQWQSLLPKWEESLSFRDVSAASELLVEVWDVGGSTRGARQLERLSQDPNKVIASSRFLGSVEVPLASTLAMSRGKKHTFHLMRRTAADNVSGCLRLSFAWNVTARNLLNLKLAALERVLAQRTEVICMLNPVQAETALHWAKEDSQHALPAPESGKAEEVERSEPSTTRSEERTLADRVLAKHLHEEHHSTLTVSVMEARGLTPRSGVVVAFQATQLPNPMVEVSVPGHGSHRVRAKHTVNPRWETAEPARYKRLSSDSRVTVRLYDEKSKKALTLLGENTISCSRLTGDKPMYVWLPLIPAAKPKFSLRKRRAAPTMERDLEETPALQVHVRLQWVRQVVRGQYMNAEVSLAGLGLIVMGGLQDELFNLTVDNIRVELERTHLEARISGSVKRLQLDNQMLDATQPVVLAPATVAHAHSKTAQVLTGGDGGLIEFGIARSFANSVLGDQAGEPGSTAARQVGSPPGVLEKERPGEGSSTIMSFKEVWLTIGELDFQADDGFLEAILSFVVSIPMADVWQDDAWREQQRKLLTAQFGPREVETLSMNSVLPIDIESRSKVQPLEWIQAKEHRELQVLRDQSSYSSWYFIERAYISEINANVTIALTSSVLSNRADAAAAAAQRAGLFSRFIRASGFQLINVNNVPLSLGSWSLDTKLLGRKAMVNALSRHYFAQGISEAHKVLGGAGPAIAAVPLTVVWVGGSFITLLTGISSGKVGPIGAAQRIGYVFFMSVAQVVGSLSRMGLSLMTFVPPNRTGVFSDSVTLAQAVQRPANAFEAFGRCWEELFDSLMAASVGILLDPTQGYHTGGLPLAFIGMLKGIMGLAVRPAVGILELVSKGTQGMGLVFLGREAITGSAQRRVRAPGALAEEQTEGDEATMPELHGQQRNVVAAWQQALSHMFPSVKDDVVMEVINTHANRTLILCKQHVLLVRSTSLALRSMLKSLWVVPISEIKIVRGEDDKLRINLDFTTKVDARCFGVWTIPRRKSIRCGSRDLMERIIVRINRHMSSLNAGPEESFANLFEGSGVESLSIYKAPYTAAPA